MSTHFKMYRVLCSTPPNLDQGRVVFEDRLSQFAENVSMPAGVLFPPASFRPDFDARASRAAIESNIRMVEFFVQIFGAEMPDPVFLGFVNLALACVDDPAIPLRHATVLFKHSPDASPELEKLQATLTADPRCAVRTYREEQELGTEIQAMLEDWFAMVHP